MRAVATTGAVLLGLLVLAGCSSIEPGSSVQAVQREVQQVLGTAHRVELHADAPPAAAIDSLLAAPLDADAAVRLALLNHRGLQARLHALGATEAEARQAARLPNPGFSFGRTKQGDEVEIERGLHSNLARLLVLPLAARAEERRLEASRREAARDVLALAAEVRRAWVTAVAAAEAVRWREQVHEAADASAELARRMESVGNFNRLMRAREQGFHADATLALARAQQAEMASRERLVRLLGLWGSQVQALKLPPRLPDLPAAALEQPDIERLALARRLDVHAAVLATEQTARNLGLTRTSRFVNVLELGLVRNSSNEAPRQTGWEVTLELPLFDGGGARVARAEAVYRQALHQAAQTAIEARSEVREAYRHYRFAHDIARHHREELVPLRRRISEEQLLRYNGMLVGVFELLADARAQIAAVGAALDVLRDFWLAQAELDQAMVGKPKLAMPTASTSASTSASTAAAEPAGH
jgi:outer membrane protein TolC